MNADLVDFLACLENLAGTELDAEVTTFTAVVDYENIRVTKLQPFRRMDGFSARFGRNPWLNCP
jgi:hypothetical protein